ncbi:hypothetical protein BDQ17DRAFT_1427771 [Cyathus striatus]|nr:hypothetical protein BDQ17DRAFT_1427771 [Cyathus striatus]
MRHPQVIQQPQLPPPTPQQQQQAQQVQHKAMTRSKQHHLRLLEIEREQRMEAVGERRGSYAAPRLSLNPLSCCRGVDESYLGRMAPPFVGRTTVTSPILFVSAAVCAAYPAIL